MASIAEIYVVDLNIWMDEWMCDSQKGNSIAINQRECTNECNDQETENSFLLSNFNTLSLSIFSNDIWLVLHFYFHSLSVFLLIIYQERMSFMMNFIFTFVYLEISSRLSVMQIEFSSHSPISMSIQNDVDVLHVANVLRCKYEIWQFWL